MSTFNKSFKDWYEKSSLTFLRKEDENTDYALLAVFHANLELNRVLQDAGKEDDNGALVLAELYFPLICNQFAVNFYFGANNECCYKTDFLQELRDLLKLDKFSNYMDFFKAREKTCECKC